MQFVFEFQEKMFYSVICVSFTMALEGPIMLNAAEPHGQGQALPQKLNRNTTFQ